jgi:hypothetical protein
LEFNSGRGDDGQEHNFLIVDTPEVRSEIRFEHIEQLSLVEQFMLVKLIYFVPDTNIFGMTKKDMKKVYLEFECFEHDLLLKTYQSVRNKMY